MRKLRLAALGAITAILTSCASFSNRGTLEKPFIGSANTDLFSFDAIDLSDSATVVRAVVTCYPGASIALSGNSKLVGSDGRVYPLIALEGIDADRNFVMPDSGRVRFSMVFPPLSPATSSIDFLEDVDGGFCLWDIDLTGNPDKEIYSRSIPAGLRAPFDSDAQLPAPVFVYDSTHINITVAGYRPQMGNLSYRLATLHGTVSGEEPLKVDSLGHATLSVALAAPASLTVRNASSSATATLSPGENIDLFLDSHVSGITNMARRDGRQPEYGAMSFHNGAYSMLDHAAADLRPDYSFGDFRSGLVSRMTGEEFIDFVTSRYIVLDDSLNNDSILPDMLKKMVETGLQADLARAVTLAGRRGTPINSEDISRVASLIDFTRPEIYQLADNSLGNTDVWRSAGIETGAFEEIRLYTDAYRMASGGELTDSLFSALRASNGAFASDARAHNEYMKDRLSRLDFSRVTPAPEVAPEKLIDAIVAPYKGKVVVVDLWNTWCGPCRNALALNEPEKTSGALTSPDIVWIYIADESSPVIRYIPMIDGIKGVHYRLDAASIAAIRKQFEVDGIPYYILVDKMGKVAGRPDLRDHDKFKAVILEELAR